MTNYERKLYNSCNSPNGFDAYQYIYHSQIHDHNKISNRIKRALNKLWDFIKKIAKGIRDKIMRFKKNTVKTKYFVSSKGLNIADKIFNEGNNIVNQLPKVQDIREKNLDDFLNKKDEIKDKIKDLKDLVTDLHGIDFSKDLIQINPNQIWKTSNMLFDQQAVITRELKHEIDTLNNIKEIDDEYAVLVLHTTVLQIKTELLGIMYKAYNTLANNIKESDATNKSNMASNEAMIFFNELLIN